MDPVFYNSLRDLIQLGVDPFQRNDHGMYDMKPHYLEKSQLKSFQVGLFAILVPCTDLWETQASFRTAYVTRG